VCLPFLANAARLSSMSRSKARLKLKSGPHRARRRVGGGVEIKLLVANRRRIVEARVEKRLEVKTVPARDQHFGHVPRAVECELPYPGVGTKPVEHRGPWQRRGHHDEVRHLVPKSLRIGISRHQTDIVADQEFREPMPLLEEPRTAIAWGRNHSVFTIKAAEAVKADVPSATLTYYDGGHFALDEYSTEISAQIIHAFAP